MTDQYMQGLATSASFSRMLIAGGIYKLVTMKSLWFLQLSHSLPPSWDCNWLNRQGLNRMKANGEAARHFPFPRRWRIFLDRR